ncbi:MAG TPA: uridine kinase, partial [Flavobacteriales bacterium]|nr:uridine kinase [Flavobacteriales bacterium]
DMITLKSGEIVELDTYTYNRSAMISERIKVEPAKWLVVEGLFALYDDTVREMIDISAFIDASVETRLERRKHRDLTIRGYSPDEVQYQWDNHVRPADIKFIEPWKGKCDVVINNEEHWEHGLRELIYKMESI